MIQPAVIKSSHVSQEIGQDSVSDRPLDSSDENIGKYARLFTDYMDEGEFYSANFRDMRKRQQHVIHPETTFERVILQCLERGTLQNQLFDDPGRLSHKAMRSIVGGFLRLPTVKKALMTETLNSRFLSAIAAGASRSGKPDVMEL